MDLGHGANSWRWSGSPHRSGCPAANVISVPDDPSPPKKWGKLKNIGETVRWKTSVDSATQEMSVSRITVMKPSNPSSWFDPVDIWSSSLLTKEFHRSEKVSYFTHHWIPFSKENLKKKQKHSTTAKKIALYRMMGVSPFSTLQQDVVFCWGDCFFPPSTCPPILELLVCGLGACGPTGIAGKALQFTIRPWPLGGFNGAPTLGVGWQHLGGQLHRTQHLYGQIQRNLQHHCLTFILLRVYSWICLYFANWQEWL